MNVMLFDIQRNSYVDGPGIRTTVFFKGCNLRCRWCHNPESQSPEKEILFYREKCTGCGRCRDLTAEDDDFLCFHDAKEICGREYTIDAVMDILTRDRPYYDASGGGATFSGGECMLQPEALAELLERCRAAGIHTAVDTAGDVPWERFERILPWTDLFLYDVKCVSEDLHRAGTGVSNRRILENLQRLSASGAAIRIRVPVIPGFNADEAEMRRIAAFLAGIRHAGAELLPYHALGEHKYAALGREGVSFAVPGREEMEAYRALFA